MASQYKYCMRQGRLLVKAVSTMQVLIHYFAVQANSTTAVGLVDVSIFQTLLVSN